MSSLSPQQTNQPQSSNQSGMWIKVVVAIIGAVGVIIAAIIPRCMQPVNPTVPPTTPVGSTSQPSSTVATCTKTEILNATWQVTRGCDTVHFNYNNGTSSPEYASLDMGSGYFRMNYGPTSSWGTSIVLLPVFWSKDACLPHGLCQGAPVKIVDGQLRTEGTDLIVPIDGHIGGLHVLSVVRLLPPMNNALRAQVTTTLEGTVQLDKNRPNEAFKPITLTSMYDSQTQWDAQQAYTDTSHFDIPVTTGWILHSPITTHGFGLQGGTSSWKTNAPTIDVVMTQPVKMNVTGWVMQDNNPQDDNVACWTTSDTVLKTWSYTVTASA